MPPSRLPSPRSRAALARSPRAARAVASLAALIPAASAALLALAASGCSPAPLAPPVLYALPATEEDGCAPALTPIGALDEPTPLGFAAIEALNRLGGPRASSLDWIEPAFSEEYELALGPERGRSTLELAVLPREGPVLHRHRTPLPTSPEGTACDPGALEIPVTVTLQSGAQGLAESVDATLEARAPYRGRVAARLAPGELRGGLGLARVLSLDPARAFWLAAIDVEIELWEGGSAGTLSVELGARHAKAPSGPSLPPAPPAPPGSIAVWPSAAPCEEGRALPADAKVLGFSVADVLDELRGSGPRAVTWSDGGDAPLVLELGAGAPELCQAAAGESLSFAATLRARTEDGELDVRSPVRVEAFDAGGRVGAIRVESADPDAGLTSAPDSTGASGDDAALRVAVEWTHDGALDTGSLALHEPEAPALDASGTPPPRPLPVARW